MSSWHRRRISLHPFLTWTEVDGALLLANAGRRRLIVEEKRQKTLGDRRSFSLEHFFFFIEAFFSRLPLEDGRSDECIALEASDSILCFGLDVPSTSD